jgi:penicillin-binding protein-related factor A (putative recombinase)
MMARLSQSKGKVGQDIAIMILRTMGVQMVEAISTPFVVTHRKKGGWIKIAYSEPVSGDINGIMPNGIRVLCEVKARDRNLRKSDFEDHQLAALQENHNNFGISLVAWIHRDDNMILRWPFIHNYAWFEDGQRASLKIEDAQEFYLWDGRS